MEQTNTKKGFGWGYLILGILFIIASLVAFANPASNLEALAFIFGFVAIMDGIWLIINRRQHSLRIVAGIIDIIIGIIILVNIAATIVALPILFAIWFIVDSLFRLFTLGYTKALGAGYFWFSLIVNILGVILGILLLFNPFAAVLTISFLVGFYLMLIGVELVIVAFS